MTGHFRLSSLQQGLCILLAHELFHVSSNLLVFRRKQDFPGVISTIINSRILIHIDSEAPRLRQLYTPFQPKPYFD